MFLPQLMKNKQYGFEEVDMQPEDMTKRIEFLCEFFRDITNVSKSTSLRSINLS